MFKFISRIGLLMAAFLFSFAFVAIAAFAQDIPADPTTVNDVIQALAALVGVSTTAGATTLAIVLAASQMISKFVLSPLWDNLKLDQKYKFLVFGLMSIAMAVVPLMMQGASFVSALTSGSVLLIVMQYGHRIYELFIEKKE